VIELAGIFAGLILNAVGRSAPVDTVVATCYEAFQAKIAPAKNYFLEGALKIKINWYNFNGKSQILTVIFLSNN